jgi:endonuclease-3 related protein
VGAILTQNTNWTNVEKAITNLKKNGKLIPEVFRRISERALAKLIRPAGYFNVKANRLKHFIRFLYSDYRGSVRRLAAEKGDKLRQKLLAVKGIGPETADSILLYAAQKPYFVIDAYTKRIFSRHRLFRYEHSYEAWRRLFQDALPQKISLYNDFHAQIVAVGKHFCRTKPDSAAIPNTFL